MNVANYVVFDFETDGVNPHTCQPLELAAIVVDPRTLLPVHGAEFTSLIKPEAPDKVDKRALQINHLKMEELVEAPDQKTVWNDFVQFVNSYQTKDGKIMRKPIPCGYNIKGYDLIIANRLNEAYHGKEIFSRFSVDVMDISFLWFESNPKVLNLKLDTLRQFFGMASDQSHRALFDVKQTADLLGRYVRLMRRIKVNWNVLSQSKG